MYPMAVSHMSYGQALWVYDDIKYKSATRVLREASTRIHNSNSGLIFKYGIEPLLQFVVGCTTIFAYLDVVSKRNNGHFVDNLFSCRRRHAVHAETCRESNDLLGTRLNVKFNCPFLETVVMEKPLSIKFNLV
ncbi:hypothetical protein TNCT_295161 [Trichonephila clavata]|uniref:Uncharacterized protein n=1 Tax=Trichonephila clavata TaxID=2740835 RepID=A0A8X6LPU9_TRICU|nr:hypothetical protein TNCT_295161 [Trichonephila clavata]